MMEHRCLFKRTIASLSPFPMFDPELIFQVSQHPHFTHDIPIPREVRIRDKLHDIARAYISRQLSKTSIWNSGSVRTECDENGEENGYPEETGSTQDNDLVYEITAGEERIDDDPEHHHSRRSNDNNPSNHRPTTPPTSVPIQKTRNQTKMQIHSLVCVHTDIGVSRENGSNRHRSTKVSKRLDGLSVPR